MGAVGLTKPGTDKWLLVHTHTGLILIYTLTLKLLENKYLLKCMSSVLQKAVLSSVSRSIKTFLLSHHNTDLLPALIKELAADAD